MHPVLETLEEIGIVSERDLLEIGTWSDKKALKAYETLHTAVLVSQRELTSAHDPVKDPFSFLASASMRGEGDCWEFPCRLEKLSALARYSALYATRVVVPLPLKKPEKLQPSGEEVKFLLMHAALTLLSLRIPVDAGVVIPVVLISNHCKHTWKWVEEMMAFVHAVTDDYADFIADKFRVKYQPPTYSPSGRATLYLDGPTEFLEHGSSVILFDESPEWRVKSWRYDKNHMTELGIKRKTPVIRRILHRSAIDTTFFLAFGRQHGARLLTDKKGEAFFLEFLTDDDELVATSAAVNQALTHSVPLLNDLPIAALLRIRKEEQDAFESYRNALSKVLSDVLAREKRLSGKQAQQLFAEYIEPQLRKMKLELNQQQEQQANRLKGGVASLAASVALGAFGSVMPKGIEAA